MIFSVSDHIKQIIAGTKTQTRRSSSRYKEKGMYAIQPSRTSKGISEGKIFVYLKTRETKTNGYPIDEFGAKSEGGYNPTEYEKLYEKLNPNWVERWAYRFKFFTTKELGSLTNGG